MTDDRIEERELETRRSSTSGAPRNLDREPDMSFEEAMLQGDNSTDFSNFRSLEEGDRIQGTVVHIDRSGVLVDVGQKSEGIIPLSELSRDQSNPDDVVKVGDTVDVIVLESDETSREGTLILSKKRADFERAWDRVEEAFRDQRTITAMVTDRVKGGLTVDLGIRGFVPASHVGSGKQRNLDKYIGQSIPLKVIEVDRERRKVVLSHKNATEEEREAQRQETLGSLAEGQQRPGVVRRLTDYGAFIDLGGIDGLLHISEMSWSRVKHPSEVLKVGDEVQVVILKMTPDQGRISLGMRQILPDPWERVAEKYHPGESINATVTRLVPFGAFVQLEEGIEGIIPNSELAHRRVNRPEDVVQVGQEVELKVLDVRPEERRMTLSLRQAQAQQQMEREQKTVREYERKRRDTREDRVTLGDVYGDLLDDMDMSGTGDDEEA